MGRLVKMSAAICVEIGVYYKLLLSQQPNALSKCLYLAKI